MDTYRFTLIVDGPDLQDEELIDKLYEAGCDDALVGSSHGVQCVDFDRKAATIEDAILSAIANVESLGKIETVRIVDAGLVSMADIAARTGRTRESVRLLMEGKRGPGGFPPPVTDPRRQRYRLWRWAEVDRWLQVYVPDHRPDDQEQVATAINAGLEFRRLSHLVGPGQRKALKEMMVVPDR